MCHGGGEDWVCTRSRGGAHGAADGVSAGRSEMLRHGERERRMGHASGGEVAWLHETRLAAGNRWCRSLLGVMVFSRWASGLSTLSGLSGLLWHCSSFSIYSFTYRCPNWCLSA
jgi:hypothetical protein